LWIGSGHVARPQSWTLKRPSPSYHKKMLFLHFFLVRSSYAYNTYTALPNIVLKDLRFLDVTSSGQDETLNVNGYPFWWKLCPSPHSTNALHIVYTHAGIGMLF
jgi:hypothetical protein